MMKKMIKAQTLKGFRDFLPQEAKKRQYVINALKEVFESYGFEPLETPALEYEEVLLGKYGKEGDKLMYRFTDNGGRRVALRYDQTVPLARVVAQYGMTGSDPVTLPFKRYQIQPVWRGENPQKGRYREFLQCDIDIVGANSLLADAEIIACALSAVQKLKIKNAMLFINDRNIFKGIEPKYIAVIDKLEKIGREEVLNELQEKGLTKQSAVKLLQRLEKTAIPESVSQLFKYLKPLLTEGLMIEFRPTLARGLDYYTGAIFELIIQGKGGNSIGGGGRYDNLIGIFTGKSVPAVGFSFGFDRLIEAMEELNLFPDNLVSTKVLVTLFDESLCTNSIKVAATLRQAGVNTELYPQLDKLEKQLKYADRKGIPYVVILGPKEKDKGTVIVKGMSSQKQEEVSQEKLVKRLQ